MLAFFMEPSAQCKYEIPLSYLMTIEFLPDSIHGGFTP